LRLNTLFFQIIDYYNFADQRDLAFDDEAEDEASQGFSG
jgi:hypothetical protein